MAIETDRLFIAIAVGSPGGGLESLPGAVDAATRMAAWARQRGYATPPAIVDGGNVEITVDALRETIARAISEITRERELKRLVIYFAGHGAISPTGQCLMLTNWQKRSTEAIHVAALQRVLEFYGPRQVTIICDACQEFSDRFKDVLGSSILDRPDEDERQFELDQFFAVGAGKQAFMIKASAGQPAFCLFTDVLLEALSGDDASAFEAAGEERVVTSQSLTQYLLANVPRAAGKYGLRMAPEARPGFYTDKVYLALPASVGAAPPPVAAKAAPGGGGAPPVLPPTGRLESLLADVRAERLSAFKVQIGAGPVLDQFEAGCGLAVEGAEVGSVQASRGEVAIAAPNRFNVELDDAPSRLAWSDTLVTLANGRTYAACMVQGFVVALHILDDCTATLFHRHNREAAHGSDDAIDLLGKMHAGLLDEGEIVQAGALLRAGKHRYITLGCIAAQFYDAIRDVESLRSMASFYAQQGQPVPLDIVLYGGGVLREVDGQLLATIPAAGERKPRNRAEAERHFTFRGMPAVSNHPVAGRVPWMRQAWSAVATVRGDGSLDEWRGLALEALAYLGPGDFTSVTAEGRPALAALARLALQNEPAPTRSRYTMMG